MRVAITGIAGFLGSHLARAWLKEGADVVGFDDLSGGDTRNVPVGAEWFHMGCEDLEEEDFKHVEIVYHCAALAHEGLSVFSPSRITRSVFSGSVACFAAAIQAGVKRIVFTSSMARYGEDIVPFVETSRYLEPKDPYGIAKLAAEEVLKTLCKVHQTEYSIAVPHNIIGQGQCFTDPYRNVIAIWMNRILQGKRPIIYGSGNQVRCFTDVRDIVPLLVRMGTIDCANRQIFNLGPDTGWVTIGGVCEEVRRMMGWTEGVDFRPRRPREVHRAVCSADKSRKMLGFEQKYSLRESLEWMLEWIRTVGPKPFNYSIPIEIPSESCPSPWKDRTM